MGKETTSISIDEDIYWNAKSKMSEYKISNFSQLIELLLTKFCNGDVKLND